MNMQSQPLVLAYFLPQFHECQFNNEWWGKGFTEWNNVRAAKPLKTNHYQPRVPQKGYYDLTDDGEIEKQFANAKAHGIDGFVFYHYWYDSNRPLGKPLDKILSDTNIDINFSLCWANHSWTRSWKNRRGSMDVLIEQTYATSKNEREDHYGYLCKAFADSRYIQINGKPLFQIYIAEDIPDPGAYVDGLRAFAEKEIGKDLHISATVRNRRKEYGYLKHFDSATLAQPTVGLFVQGNPFSKRDDGSDTSILGLIREKILVLPLSLRKLFYTLDDLLPKHASYFDYDIVWKNLLVQTQLAMKTSPIPINFGSFSEFDNTPRYRERAKIVEGFTPEKFQSYMTQLFQLARSQPDSIIFVNAWNEWGEGMHLEGDKKYPVERLQALKKAVDFQHG